MLPAIVATNLGMRSVVLVGGTSDDDPELQRHKSQLRGKLLTNTTIVQLDPKTRHAEEMKWLLGKNEVLREMLKMVENRGKGLVQICEGSRCLNAFDMKDIETAIEELG